MKAGRIYSNLDSPITLDKKGNIWTCSAAAIQWGGRVQSTGVKIDD